MLILLISFMHLEYWVHLYDCCFGLIYLPKKHSKFHLCYLHIYKVEKKKNLLKFVFTFYLILSFFFLVLFHCTFVYYSDFKHRY